MMNNDNFYNLYLEELEGIEPCTIEEETILLEKLKAGDTDAAKRLVEGNLIRVSDLAKAYEDKGVPIADLVQEGNMALTIAVSEFKDGDFHLFLEKQITSAFSDAITLQLFETETEEEILARVNVLKEVSTIMAKELGREATLLELSDKMKMTEEEIKGIMKLTLDAISVDAE